MDGDKTKEILFYFQGKRFGGTYSIERQIKHSGYIFEAAAKCLAEPRGIPLDEIEYYIKDTGADDSTKERFDPKQNNEEYKDSRMPEYARKILYEVEAELHGDSANKQSG